MIKAAAVILVLYMTFGLLLFSYMSARNKGILALFLDRNLGDQVQDESRKKINEGREWLKALPYSDVYITSHDGLRLHARYIENPSAERLVVFCHGYRSSSYRDMAASGRDVYGLGCSILLIDQRACGESEGRYITYGVREGRDVADWVNFAYGSLAGDLPVYLDGLSLGSSSVLAAFCHEMTELPSGVIADCGFTSPYDIIKSVMTKMTGRFVSGMFMPLLGFYARVIGGFGLKGPCAREGVERLTVPLLLVHGARDGFVPYRMGEELFRECVSGSKRMLTCETASHAESFITDRQEYLDEIKKLFNIKEE